MLRSVVIGQGSFVPKKTITNNELPKHLDTNDEWIIERTGIRQRHIAAENEFTSTLAIAAGSEAIKSAGLTPADIDLVIVATTTPDETMPSTAVKVQAGLGMVRGAAFDINAACSGFIYALCVADNFIRSGHTKRVLVIGAETFSRILDWNDRGTCILFGDGAGAMLLEAREEAGTNQDRGILFTSIASDGRLVDLLHTRGGVSTTQNAGTVVMQGKEVFRHAVAKMAESVEEALGAVGLGSSEIQWVIPHQANIRILQATAKRLNVREDGVIMTVSQHANTSAASIPLAYCEGVKDGRIKQGHLIAMPALGAGLTWGSCLLRV